MGWRTLVEWKNDGIVRAAFAVVCVCACVFMFVFVFVERNGMRNGWLRTSYNGNKIWQEEKMEWPQKMWMKRWKKSGAILERGKKTRHFEASQVFAAFLAKLNEPNEEDNGANMKTGINHNFTIAYYLKYDI